MSQDVQTIRISEYVRLDKRQRSAKWQARVKLADGSWHRFSTKTEDVSCATDIAKRDRNGFAYIAVRTSRPFHSNAV